MEYSDDYLAALSRARSQSSITSSNNNVNSNHSKHHNNTRASHHHHHHNNNNDHSDDYLAALSRARAQSSSSNNNIVKKNGKNNNNDNIYGGSALEDHINTLSKQLKGLNASNQSEEKKNEVVALTQQIEMLQSLVLSYQEKYLKLRREANALRRKENEREVEELSKVVIEEANNGTDDKKKQQQQQPNNKANTKVFLGYGEESPFASLTLSDNPGQKDSSNQSTPIIASPINSNYNTATNNNDNNNMSVKLGEADIELGNNNDKQDQVKMDHNMAKTLQKAFDDEVAVWKKEQEDKSIHKHGKSDAAADKLDDEAEIHLSKIRELQEEQRHQQLLLDEAIKRAEIHARILQNQTVGRKMSSLSGVDRHLSRLYRLTNMNNNDNNGRLRSKTSVSSIRSSSSAITLASQTTTKSSADEIKSNEQHHRRVQSEGPVALSTKERLIAFYKEHNPEKLNDGGAFIDKVVEHYRGHEDQLFEELERKYVQKEEPPPSKDIPKHTYGYDSDENGLYASSSSSSDYDSDEEGVVRRGGTTYG